MKHRFAACPTTDAMPTALFDLYDTLVTLQQPDRPAQQAFADRLGLDLDDVRAWWKATVRQRLIGVYPTYEATLRALCAELGADVSPADLEAICVDRDRSRTAMLHAVTSEVLAVLRQLRERGWRIGVVSNATPDEVAPWSSSPLSAHVDDSVFSCDVGSMKPEPQIFELACDRFGIAPDAASFIGDGGFDELQAADALGMRVIKANWYRDRQLSDWSGHSRLIELADIRLVPEHLESP